MLLGDTEYTYYIRVALFWINTIFFIIPNQYNYDVTTQLKYLTVWGMNMTEFSIVLSIQAMQNFDQWQVQIIDVKPLAIWMLSSTQALNMIITVISWTVILPYMWQVNGWSTFEEVSWQINLMAQHIVPLILSSINLYLLSDVAIRYTDIWLVPVISVAYITFNFITTKISGKPAYDFLTYDNWNTVVTIIGVLFSASICFLIDATLTQWITGRWEYG